MEVGEDASLGEPGGEGGRIIGRGGRLLVDEASIQFSLRLGSTVAPLILCTCVCVCVCVCVDHVLFSSYREMRKLAKC